MTETATRAAARPRVVVVGGGFAGLSAVRRLRDEDVDVTLIDRHTYSTLQPLLYQVATASLNAGDVTWFLRTIRSKQKNVRVVNAAVEAMDHDAREVVLDDGQRVAYDHLVVAAGATANFFGIEGAQEHALPLYTRSQALAIRDEVFSHLERAAARDPDRELRIIVVGGGATGVETAGALAELRNRDMAVTYPELDPARTHITLLEMMPVLLKPFSRKAQEYALASLVERGVDVRVDTAVQEVRPDGVVDADGNHIPAGIVVWASGVTVHDVVSQWDLPQGKGGRVQVDDHLRVVGRDGVLAAGDIAAGPGDDALPQLAQPALQGGRYAAGVIAARVRGEPPPPPFRYRDKGMMATIGRRAAVAQVKHLPTITGTLAWLLWMAVHVFYLLGVRNRIATIVNLSARYVFWRHGHDAIVGETDLRGPGPGTRDRDLEVRRRRPPG